MTTFFLIRHATNESIGKWISGRMSGVQPYKMKLRGKKGRSDFPPRSRA